MILLRLRPESPVVTNIWLIEQHGGKDGMKIECGLAYGYVMSDAAERLAEAM